MARSMDRPDSCPLCAGADVRHVATGTVARQARDYWRCGGCRLVFVPRPQLPDPGAELARYREHDNDPDDPDYREHLAPVARTVRDRLAGGARGLDYGAGPGPALAAMLEEAGYAVRLYDPFFQPDPAALERRYDFLTCTETAEHFHRPAEEFRRLDGLLRPGGWLFVMTSLYERAGQFPEWWYSRDPTHVSFYHRDTMLWIAAEQGWEADFPEADVVAFHKPRPVE